MIDKIFKIIVILPNLFLRIFRKRDLPIKNVAVIQMAKLGDMVCTTPMFRALKSAHPEWNLLVVGNSTNKEVIKYNKDIDEYFVWDRKSDLSLELKKRKIDAVIIPGPNDEALYGSLKAGVPKILVSKIENGWSPYETITFRFLRFFVKKVPLHMGKYAPREYLSLLEPLGIISSDTKKHLSFSNKALEKAENFFLEKSIDIKNDFVVGISPSAGNKIKEWPEERFAEIADYLVTKYQARVILVGGPADTSIVQKVINHVDNSDFVLNTQGQFNLDESKALISRFHIFVSVDTGPIYIAEAFNIPTIDITGPIDENEQPPISPRNRVVVPVGPRKPQLFVMNARSYNREEALRQVQSITTKAVKNETDSLISYLRSKK